MNAWSTAREIQLVSYAKITISPYGTGASASNVMIPHKRVSATIGHRVRPDPEGTEMKTNEPLSLGKLWNIMGIGAAVALGLVAVVWGVLHVFVI